MLFISWYAPNIIIIIAARPSPIYFMATCHNYRWKSMVRWLTLSICSNPQQTTLIYPSTTSCVGRPRFDNQMFMFLFHLKTIHKTNSVQEVILLIIKQMHFRCVVIYGHFLPYI